MNDLCRSAPSSTFACTRALAIIALAIAGCGTDDGASTEGASAGAAGASGSAGGGGGGAAGGGTGGTAPEGWQTLIEGEWSMPMGMEDYACVRKTLPYDVWISEFEAINPTGTHHTVLTVGEPSGPDGVEPCEVFTNAKEMVFGSGVGTNPFAFPEGVGIRLQKGQQLLLNLHLFNTGGAELSGTSGTRAKVVAASAIQYEAEAILMGTFDILVPPNQMAVASGDCAQNGDVTIISVAPHMHQTGTHMKVTAKSSVAGDVVIHDGPYDFDSQLVHLIEPVEMKRGDRVNVECTYVNDTTRTISFGDSSLQEMCFAGIFRYPPFGTNGLACADE